MRKGRQKIKRLKKAKNTLLWSVPWKVFYTIKFFTWDPSANDLSEAELEKENTDESPVVVGQYNLVYLMWFNIFVFGGALLITLIKGYILALFFATVTIAGILGLSIIPEIQITGEGVEVRNWWRRYFVRWQDIEKYQVDKQGSVYVLYTANGRLPIPSMQTWEGLEKRRARALFSRKIDELDVPCQKTEKVHNIIFPKNVTIS